MHVASRYMIHFLMGALALASACVPVPPNPMAVAHAHNDYEHPRPLLDALDHGFPSVEADIWLVDGEILVSHNPRDYKGRLVDLYLDPLQERVNAQGSVHGDGAPFYLWLDLKDGSERLRDVLDATLAQYPMVATFGGAHPSPKPVVVILTGHAASKSAFVEGPGPFRACRDSNHYRPDDPPADGRWLWYALSWRSYIQWNGRDPIDPSERDKLQALVNDIHAKGRRVRFYATPDGPPYWALAREVGVDLINTDHLEDLNQFLKTGDEQ